MKHVPLCPKCGLTGKRVDEFDAYGCGVCNEWLEDVCGDEACDMCKNRPATPVRGEE